VATGGTEAQTFIHRRKWQKKKSDENTPAEIQKIVAVKCKVHFCGFR